MVQSGAVAVYRKSVSLVVVALCVAVGCRASAADGGAPLLSLLTPLDAAPYLATPADAGRHGPETDGSNFAKPTPRIAVRNSDASALDASGGWQRIFDMPHCADRLVCPNVTRGGDVHLKPHAGGLHVGAMVWVGEQGIGVNAHPPESGWYAFAGADTQALRWDLKDGRDDTRVHMRDTRLLGDLQIGLGRNAFGGDLTFGYVAREVSHIDRKSVV